MLDFNDYYQPLRELLISSVLKFEHEQPSIQWSMLAFEVMAHSGCGFLSIDTEEHSNLLVQQFPDDAASDVLALLTTALVIANIHGTPNFSLANGNKHICKKRPIGRNRYLAKSLSSASSLWNYRLIVHKRSWYFSYCKKL